MQKLVSRIGSKLRNWKIPRDGARRYFFFTTYNPGVSTDNLFFCNVDGNIERTIFNYKPLWDANLYFTVNLAFGRLSFSTVKVIDAGWDAIVGRGGHALAAIMAYPTLRRSLTLTLETCTIKIPTISSLYCQPIQLLSIAHLMHNMFWHWGPCHSTWKQPIPRGRLRLMLQVFICIYVLFFATVVSVMTGYRAQLVGYFGHETEQVLELQSINQLSRPMMVISDGNRVGLPDDLMHAFAKFPVPLTKVKHRYRVYETYVVNEMVDKSFDFEEPYGVLVDYYYTCMGLIEWAYGDLASTPTSYSFKCLKHECACSIREFTLDTGAGRNFVAAQVTSNITLGGKVWDLAAPPLKVGLAGHYDTYSSVHYGKHYNNASDFWSGILAHPSNTSIVFTNYSTEGLHSTYMINDTEVDEETIKRTGRCIADDAYSWGFSSLILLTFCCYTIFFSLMLIILQTDVYWNSRHDRDFQYHSIYTDVLYLAEEFKAIFGDNVKYHLQAPLAS